MIIKRLLRGLFAAITLLTLMLSSHSASAQVSYWAFGTIQQIDRKQLVLSDRKFHIMASTKVVLSDQKNGELSDLQPGQVVGIKVLKLDNKRLADTIEVRRPSTETLR